MNFKKIGIVAGYEYTTRVKKKSFILITILSPLLIGLLICVPILIQLWGRDELKMVKVVDESGFVRQYLEGGESAVYLDPSPGETLESIRDDFESQNIYAVVGISTADETGAVKVVTYSREPLSLTLRENIKRSVDKAVEDRRLAALSLQDLDRILDQIKSDVPVETLTITRDGETKKDSVGIYMALSYLMSFFIYMFVFIFGAMVMNSVRQEKNSRVVEVIVSSVNATDLMLGKIFGVAMVALTQFLIWIALTFAVVTGVSAAAGISATGMGDAAALVQDISSSTTSAPGIHPDGAEEMAASLQNADEGMFGEYFEQIRNMNWGYILICFCAYFLLGYLLYASLFAAIGSIGDTDSDTQQLQLVVTVPLIAGLFIMLHTFEHPGSALSVWASIIPFTSPMVMLARVPFGVVPLWQLLLSIAMLILAFIGIAWVSARIYRTGIILYGRKTSFKEILNWLKQKN